MSSGGTTIKTEIESSILPIMIAVSIKPTQELRPLSLVGYNWTILE